MDSKHESKYENCKAKLINLLNENENILSNIQVELQIDLNQNFHEQNDSFDNVNSNKYNEIEYFKKQAFRIKERLNMLNELEKGIYTIIKKV